MNLIIVDTPYTCHEPDWWTVLVVCTKNHFYAVYKWELPCRVALVSCPARARLLVKNGLVNEVEFLGLITQMW